MQKETQNMNSEKEQDEVIRLKQVQRQGNVAFLDGKMYEAIKCYTVALEKYPTNSEVLSNRGAAYIRVKAYENAKQDLARTMILEGSPNIKTLYRLSKALWGLKQYDEIIACLEEISNKWDCNKKSDRKTLIELIKVSKRLKNESQYGHYNMSELIKKQEQTYDCAEYVGPLEIRQSVGKGRGLFATQDIQASQVVLSSKAFAIVFPDSKSRSTELPPKCKVNDQGDCYKEDPKHEKLVNLIVDIIQANPNASKEFYQLHAGRKLRNLNQSTELLPNEVIDIQRISKICYYNAFFSATNPNPKFSPDPSVIDEVRNVNTYGVWLLPSYLNHSCVDINCDLQKYGDFIIVRAMKNISKGDELLISYVFPTLPYSARISDFLGYGFTCFCRLCKLDKRDSDEIHNHRKELMQSFLQTSSEHESTISPLESLEAIQSQLKDLRPHSSDLNFSLVWINRQIGFLHNSLLQYEKAALNFEESYNLCKSTSLAREGIRFAFQACLSYVNARNKDKAREWMTIFSNDIKTVYGSMDVISVIVSRENIAPIKLNELMKKYYCQH